MHSRNSRINITLVQMNNSTEKPKQTTKTKCYCVCFFLFCIENGFTAYLLNKFNSIHMNAKFKMKKNQQTDRH